jgi:phosphoglycerol transferase MdoB-like AlkP superfamily enzyme
MMRNIRQVNDLFFVFLLPLVALLISESFFRGGLLDAFRWVGKEFNAFLLNYLLYFAFINLFYFLNRRFYVFVAFIMAGILVIGSFISRVKTIFRGEPLLPWDLFLKNEATDISQYLKTVPLTGIVVVGILLLAGGLFFLIFLKNEPYHFVKRIGIPLVSLLTMISILFNMPIPFTNLFQVTDNPWNQKQHSDENGYALGMLLNFRWIKVDVPKNYSKQQMELITKPKTQGNMAKKPNLIFIQSEAFWDPYYLGENVLSEDPIPFIRSLMSKHTSGTMIAPVFGGGTANTEFEAITGLSTQFLPSGATAFSQYINEPIHAMPWVLRQQNYQTTGIHTYHSWFYRRNLVYQNLGFNRFIGHEFFLYPQLNGSYIKDMELSKRILEEMKNTKELDYVYAVSMEAHGPYSPLPKVDEQIKVTAKGISTESKGILERYVNILSEVDKSVQFLVEELEKRAEPTILVFYGDHLPLLGNEYKVYKELGYYKGDSSHEEYKRMYSVPLLVWSNVFDTREDLRLSANMLPGYVFQKLNWKPDSFYQFQTQLYGNGQRVLPRKNFWKEEGVDEELMKRYHLLQYDLMFGKKYTLGKDSYDPSAFQIGTGRLELKGAYPGALVSNLDKQTLTIVGSNFKNGTKVVVNGEEVMPNIRNEQLLNVTITEDFVQKKETELGLVISDSIGTVLQKTKSVLLPTVASKADLKKKYYQKMNLSRAQWEFFRDGPDFVTIRTKLDADEVPYTLQVDGQLYEDANADTFNKPGQADLYPNGYFYITVPKSLLGNGLQAFLDTHRVDMEIPIKGDTSK